MVFYHWSPYKFNKLDSNYQGIHVASTLQISYDLTVNRNLDFNTGYVYEVQLANNLRPAQFDIDTMDWGAWDILNLLLGKLGEKEIQGATAGLDAEGNNWSYNVDPSVVHIPAEKLRPYKNSLLARFDQFKKIKYGKDVNKKIRAFNAIKKLLIELGYNCISYKNYGENSLGDLCYILFEDNQVSSLTSLGSGADVLATNKLNESFILTEDTRTQFAIKSRNTGMYKDKSLGKNRFERKNKSRIANSVKQYNKIDMNQLFKNDRLEVQIPVIGETDNYDVTIRLDGVIAEIARNIKINKYKLEFRTILQSLTKVFNTKDVYVNCSCPDFTYNFKHWSVINNYGTTDSAHDPGAGKGIANPNNDKGNGCKHVLLVISNGDWLIKVASVINNFIHYMSEKEQKKFLKVLFPKLYGCNAEEMAKLDILGKEEVEDALESSTSFIDAINEYGKNRGKIKKGSNRNTANKAVEPNENTYNNDNEKNLKKAEAETAEANAKAAKEAEEREKALEAERQEKIEAAKNEDSDESSDDEN